MNTGAHTQTAKSLHGSEACLCRRELSKVFCMQNEAKEEVAEAKRDLADAQKAIRACDESSTAEESGGRKRLQKRKSSTAELADHEVVQKSPARQRGRSQILSDDEDDDDLMLQRK